MPDMFDFGMEVVFLPCAPCRVFCEWRTGDYRGAYMPLVIYLLDRS